MGFILRHKILASIFTLLFGVATVAGTFVYESVRNLPDIGDVKGVIKNQTTYIYAADGTVITRLFHENRTIVPLNQISPVLQKAVISVEDQRFYEHKGIDYVRIIGALVRDVKNREAAQGASTITQQYVKNAYFSPEKTVQRKIREAFLATALERNYSKEQILEKYLNTIYFGSGAYGVEAASESYFGIPATKLSVEQSALLAGMIKNPAGYNPYKYPTQALERRNLVIDLMAEQGYISKAEAKAAEGRLMSVLPKKQSYVGIAPYYADWLIRNALDKTGFNEKDAYSQGLKIYTTLDPKMQESAELAWKKYLPSPRDPDVSLVAIDPKTGAVKAMVGGKDYNKQKLNIATQGPRQPGSAFKPFTLTAALMSGISPDDRFDASSPQTFKIPGNRPWTVHNSSGESGAGSMSLRRGTAWSVNVVYAGLVAKIGVDKVIDAARLLGITADLNANPAITLGGLKVGVTPFEMASAYSTFANNGQYNEPYGVERIDLPNGQTVYKHKAEPRQVINAAVAYLVTDILREVISGGTGTRARIGRPAAGKTGTTQNYCDAWFCGYTPDLAAAVWVGFKDGNTPMRNIHGIKVVGGKFPAQIWSAFMKRALKNVPEHDFADAPRGSLTYISLCDESNKLAGEFCPKVSRHVFVRKYKTKNLKVCDIHKPIPVPNLIGMTQVDAIKALTELKLGSSVVNKPSDAPTGQVFEQNPAEGTGVKEGTIIELSISSGLINNQPQSGEGIAVPNVVGLTLDQAQNELEGSGFLVTGEYRLSDQPAGTVIGQRPPAGYMTQPGSMITLVISGEGGQVVVPNVIGLSEGKASQLLQSKGFSVVVSSDMKKKNVKKYGLGIVSSQSPGSRSRVNEGSQVTIYVTAQ